MTKTMLRPLRLIRLNTAQVNQEVVEKKVVREVRANKGINNLSSVSQAHEPIESDTSLGASGITEAEIGLGEDGAQHLLQRTPRSYLLNQIYGLWFFLSWFFLMALITRKVSTEQFGILAVALTAYNTILYIVAFGLEDALVTYVPRVFAEHGEASAGLLIRRLLLLRLGVLILSTIILIFSLPLLANLIDILPIAGARSVADGLRSPQLLGHILPIAIYVLGSGIANLLSTICSALMRMQLVLIIGGLMQVALLGLGFIVLQLGWGINGILWLLAISSLASATAYALWQARILLIRGAEYKQPLGPVLKLGISAWLSNLVNGALLKQLSFILLAYFAISLTEQGFFNLSFQLADAASLLLVAGFQGVGASALAAAAVSKNYVRLGRSWDALIKVETLLAVPGLVFCLFNSQNIVAVLYSSAYAPVGRLLAIFLFFNILYRVLGTTIHQATLYVMGRARLVVLGQFLSLLALFLLGIALIPRLGAAGALIADGIAKALIGALLLAFLWRDLPSKYPLGFTLRFLLALTIAALPSILWHPANRILLGISGCIFLILCVGILLLIKPLSTDDMEMIGGVNPRVVRYLRWFARG